MAENIVAEQNAGDFHFELHKKDDGKYTCMRSDVSAPAHKEVVTDLREIPQNVFSAFNKLMY